MVSNRRVEANPEKIKTIYDKSPPKIVKDVQCLAGRIAALNRFISKLAKRCLPFFRTLKHSNDFWWMKECQKAFDNLKSILAPHRYQGGQTQRGIIPVFGSLLYGFRCNADLGEG